MNPTLQNLLWEKNPTGIQDFMYPLTEAELRQLVGDVPPLTSRDWDDED